MNKGLDWTQYVWKPIPSAINYYTCREGLILSLRRRTPIVMSPVVSADGHLYIFINFKKRWIHHLVLETFDKPRPDGLQCRHLDGNPQNNRAENLAWGTHAENVNDRWIHGTMPVGFKSVTVKLNHDQIVEIKSFCGSGQSSRTVAKKYGVSHTTILEIWRGSRWSDE